MGIKRETYERQFRERFAEVIAEVDKEVQKWRERLIEVRKIQDSPEKFVYVIEWQGQPLDAFALEFRKDASGYPYIVFQADNREHTIYQLRRNPYKKEAEILDIICSLRFLVGDIIIAEAKKIALREGLFATLKNGALVIPIGDYEFRLIYSKNDNAWEVKCDKREISWAQYECNGCHPLDFFPHLLRALALRHLL
jgi:hypothetical protein